MPTLSQLATAGIPAGVSLAQYIASRRGLNSATSTVQQGAAQAGQQINTATAAAQQAQRDALARQEALYGTTTAANAPYQDTGLKANAGYQGLIDNPATFDPNSVATDPGYQFGLSEGEKAGDRAMKGVYNGGVVKAKTRYALDYATTKYNDAFQRFRQTQQDRQNLLQGGVTIGQNANESNRNAGVNLGNQVQTNATQTGNLGVNAAEDNAALTLASSELAARNQSAQSVATGDTIGKIADTAMTIGKLFKGGAPTTPVPGPQEGDPGFVGPNSANGGPDTAAQSGSAAPLAAAGTAAAGTIGALAAGGGAAATAVPAVTVAIPELGILGGEAGGIAAGSTAAAGAAGDAAAASTVASSGGLGSTLASLATNPITIGIAGALAIGALWLKSQAHWEANDAVKHFENPYNANYLQPEMQAWDQAVAGGKMTQEQGAAAFEQYQKNFEDYIAGINKWAGNSKDKKKVAQQSIQNLYDKNILPQIQKRTAQIAAMPSAGAA